MAIRPIRKSLRPHGFLAPEILPENHLFGGLGTSYEVLQPNWQWDEFLPVDELQSKGDLETQNCTVYGTLNVIETLLYRLFRVTSNFSERYVGIASGTTSAGNDPQRVAETIRKVCGLVDESDLPFDDTVKTFEDYYHPTPLPANLLKKGIEWRDSYVFNHQYVFKPNDKNKTEKLVESLKTSPLGVSVQAWTLDGGLYVKQKGDPDNHWGMLYGGEYKKYWNFFDHYNNTHKKLAWDYDFGYAKRYSLKKAEKKKCFLEALFNGF